jgi:hypothetical protein
MVGEDACSVNYFQIKQTSELPQGERAAPAAANESGSSQPSLLPDVIDSAPRQSTRRTPRMPAAGIGPLAEHLDRYLKAFRSYKTAGRVKIDEEYLCKKFNITRRWLREMIWRLREAGRFAKEKGREKDWGKRVDVLYAPGDCEPPSDDSNQEQTSFQDGNVSSKIEERSFLGRGTIVPPTRNDPSSISAAPIQAVILKREEIKSSSNSAAAADQAKEQEKTDHTVKQFPALGVDPEAIRPHVEKDPAQAATVLAILRGRHKPPDNPTGFAIRAFEERWTAHDPPKLEPLDARKIIEQIERQRKERERAGSVSLKALQGA